MHRTSVGFEYSARLRLGEKVGVLLVGRALHNRELALLVGVPEPVPLGQEILGPVGDTLVLDQQVRALVVFKHSCMYPHSGKSFWARPGDHFLNERAQGEKDLEGC